MNLKKQYLRDIAKRNDIIWEQYWVSGMRQKTIAAIHCLSDCTIKHIIQAKKVELGLTKRVGVDLGVYVVRKRVKK